MRVRRHEPGGADDQSSTSSVRAVGRSLAQEALDLGAISSTCWPGASLIDTLATASTGSTVFCKSGEPVAMPFTSSAGSANVRR